VLGALALAIQDRTQDAVVAASGQPVSAATALSALDQFLGTPNVDALGRVLGVTHSGAVRVVDRLESAGLVSRGPGRDGRNRSIALTTAGHAAAARIAEARLDVLRDAAKSIPADDLDNFKRLLDAALERVVRAKFAAGAAGTRWTCRLCDLTACDRAAGNCPAANTARSIMAQNDQTGSSGAPLRNERT